MKTIIIGRMACNPKSVHTEHGKATHFMLGNHTVEDGVDVYTRTSIIAFGRLATTCLRHLHKGNLCCVEGQIERYEYVAEGKKFCKQTVIAERVVFLS